jgi:hypothetical protein
MSRRTPLIVLGALVATLAEGGSGRRARTAIDPTSAHAAMTTTLEEQVVSTVRTGSPTGLLHPQRRSSPSDQEKVMAYQDARIRPPIQRPRAIATSPFTSQKQRPWTDLLHGILQPRPRDEARLEGSRSDPGRSSGSSASPDGTIVVDGAPNILHSVGTGQRYISYDGRLALGMPLRFDGAIDPIVYDGFAKRYLLRDCLPLSKVGNYHDMESAYPARLDSRVPEMPALPSNAKNWILREANGTAWLVDGESRLHWIGDGAAYMRLAQMYFVRDNTSAEQIDVFRSGPYAGDARCG